MGLPIPDQFNAAGVEIMSPHYRAGNQATIPADYLAQGLRGSEVSGGGEGVAVFSHTNSGYTILVAIM